jgi:hypothetical protein
MIQTKLQLQNVESPHKKSSRILDTKYLKPEHHHSKRGGEGKLKRARGEQDALCTITSPPSQYHSWLDTDVHICNSQRSSDIL